MSTSTQELEHLAKEAHLGLTDPEFAAFLDSRDDLAHLRDEFCVPRRGDVSGEGAQDRDDANLPCTYLCGNSLGLMPKRARQHIIEELDVWAKRGVEGHWSHDHNRPWALIDETVVGMSADIVGAHPSEVAVMNTLTGNLHTLMVSFYVPTPKRYKIICETKAFPSDHYAFESQIKWHGFLPADALVLVSPRDGEKYLRTEDILDVIQREGPTTALVIFSGVQFYTGQWFEMEKITKAGHEQGCIVGWDLAHAVGNVPVQLHDWEVDFACWCSYKYLNSGPGGIAGIFVHERHAKDFDRPRFAGWWGHDKATRFEMDNVFQPTPGAYGYQLSNPSVLTTVSLLGSLELFSQATMPRLRAKSLLLTGYLEGLLDARLPGAPFRIITPRDSAQRGCQLSLSFLSGDKMLEVFAGLQRRGVICDDRKPDCIRIAPAPLYNSFGDVWRCVEVLREVLMEV